MIHKILADLEGAEPSFEFSVEKATQLQAEKECQDKEEPSSSPAETAQPRKAQNDYRQPSGTFDGGLTSKSSDHSDDFQTRRDDPHSNVDHTADIEPAIITVMEVNDVNHLRSSDGKKSWSNGLSKSMAVSTDNNGFTGIRFLRTKQQVRDLINNHGICKEEKKVSARHSMEKDLKVIQDHVQTARHKHNVPNVW